MKSTTLHRVPNESSFLFGGIEFIKTASKMGELIQCQIKGKQYYVYIANHALVEVPE